MFSPMATQDQTLEKGDLTYKFSILVRRGYFNRYSDYEREQLEGTAFERFLEGDTYRSQFGRAVKIERAKTVYMELSIEDRNGNEINREQYFFDEINDPDSDRVVRSAPKVLMVGIVGGILDISGIANLAINSPFGALFWSAAMLWVTRHPGTISKRDELTERYHDRLDIEISQEQYEAMRNELEEGRDGTDKMWSPVLYTCANYAADIAQRHGVEGIPPNRHPYIRNSVDRLSRHIRAMSEQDNAPEGMQAYSLEDRMRRGMISKGMAKRL